MKYSAIKDLWVFIKPLSLALALVGILSPWSQVFGAESAFPSPEFNSLESSASKSGSQCAHLRGSCEYYDCLDSQVLNCGTQGYALGYAKKFCEKFSRTNFPEPRHFGSSLSRILFPSEGNAWVRSVRTCLQDALENRLESEAFVSCDELRAFGFSSHPTCYTSGPEGTSFCELTPQNVSRVGLVIGLPTLLTKESTEQIQETARICVDQLGARIAAEKRILIKSDLRSYQALWKILAGNPRRIDRLMDPSSIRTHSHN